MNHYRLNFYETPLRALHESDRKPKVIESYAVPSNSRDGVAHVVRRIKAYRKPWQECDVSSEEDRVEAYICSCEDFEYNRWPSDGTIPDLENLTQCRHCQVLKHEKAENDDEQTELRFDE